MPQGTVEDKDDIFVENLNTALFLILGVLAAVASVILLGYSTIAAMYAQQFSTSFLPTSVFAVLLLAMGLGSVHLFRRRREERKRKTHAFFR